MDFKLFSQTAVQINTSIVYSVSQK